MFRTPLVILFLLLALIAPAPIPGPAARLFASRPVAARLDEDD